MSVEAALAIAIGLIDAEILNMAFSPRKKWSHRSVAIGAKKRAELQSALTTIKNLRLRIIESGEA